MGAGEPNFVSASSTNLTDQHTLARVTIRLIPFLFTCYILNYIDRTNVGFAKLHFQTSLGFSDAVFGLGLSLFFVGYLLFEIPSNLLLARFGARKTISRIMVLWGLASIATMFVTTPSQFYVGRFLLGVAEAGFVPGVVLYLSYWYDSRQRARVTSMFMLALPIAGIIGNPISGVIMSGLNGVKGLEGWQWLFLLEGLPAVLIGIVAFFYLTDRPKDARWLSSEQREAITRSVNQEERLTPHSHNGLLAVFKDFRVYVFAFAVFSQYCVVNTFAYWGPTLLKDAGLTDVRIIGLYGAIPLIVGAIGMYLAAWHSDVTGERLWHAITAQILTVIALIILPTASRDPSTAIACMAATAIGYYAFWSIFWSIPPAYFEREAAAAGIGLINCLGALGAVFASNLLGTIKASQGRLDLGLYIVAGIAAAGVISVYLAFPKSRMSTASLLTVKVA
jgi:ACS family phthalate transporter-like MFS transporter